MCLASKTDTPSISINEIDCFKILIPVGGKLFTPYRDFLFSIGEVITDEVEVPEVRQLFGVYLIEEGYFHSCITLEAAKKLLKDIQIQMKREKRKGIPKIFHAVIPPNTPYLLGGLGDICSKSLKITEECFD